MYIVHDMARKFEFVLHFARCNMVTVSRNQIIIIIIIVQMICCCTPNLVFILLRGQVKLTQFGLSCFVDQDGSTCLGPNKSSIVCRAPELLLGATKYEPSVDIWSCGSDLIIDFHTYLLHIVAIKKAFCIIHLSYHLSVCDPTFSELQTDTSQSCHMNNGKINDTS